MRGRRGGRSIAIVLATSLVALVGTVMTAGGASAHHCHKPNQLGNATLNIGGVATVGVDHLDEGTLNHNVYVCVDPPNQETWVDLTDRNPGAVGVQVDAGTCGVLGCTSLGATGIEVGLPSTSVDPPADGNGTVGGSVSTGTGVCGWVLGISTCQLGGGTFGGSIPGGEVPPVTPPPVTPPPVTPPTTVQPLIDFANGTVESWTVLASVCLFFILLPPLGPVLCGIAVVNTVVWTAEDAVTAIEDTV